MKFIRSIRTFAAVVLYFGAGLNILLAVNYLVNLYWGDCALTAGKIVVLSTLAVVLVPRQEEPK